MWTARAAAFISSFPRPRAFIPRLPFHVSSSLLMRRCISPLPPPRIRIRSEPANANVRGSLRIIIAWSRYALSFLRDANYLAWLIDGRRGGLTCVRGWQRRYTATNPAARCERKDSQCDADWQEIHFMRDSLSQLRCKNVTYRRDVTWPFYSRRFMYRSAAWCAPSGSIFSAELSLASAYSIIDIVVMRIYVHFWFF